MNKKEFINILENTLPPTLNQAFNTWLTSGIKEHGITIDRTDGSSRGVKSHCHNINDGEDVANDFKGEFTNESGVMDGFRSIWTMQTANNTGTGVLRAIIGNAYLPAGVSITGTSAEGSAIIGVMAACFIFPGGATLNGTAVLAAGLWAKVSSAIDSVLTSVKHVAAGIFTSALLVQPSSGKSSIIYLRHETTGTTLPQAIYVEGADKVGAFATFDAVGGAGFILVANTTVFGSQASSHALRILIGTTEHWIPVFSAQWAG